MTFDQYPYQRPDMDHYTKTFHEAVDAFETASTPEAQEEAMHIINRLRFDFDTMMTLSSIRHNIDTKNAFYDAEEVFFNHARPQFEKLTNRFYRAIETARFAAALKAKFGDLFFDKVAQTLKTYDDAILPDLEAENDLTHRYRKRLASAEIEFEGATRNLSQMAPFAQDRDRAIRRRAQKAVSGFFCEHERELDDIFADLVAVRHKMARKLGYRSFVQLAYDRLGRLDYNASDVAAFRESVQENLLPVVAGLFDKQGQRLNVESLAHYDLPLSFPSGNPKPKGDENFLVRSAAKMYREMSGETDAFFTFMKSKGLLDLQTKAGKAGGGFCTYIANHKAPFIFANFNGTSADVDVLTHEAGHAFQVYQSRHHIIPEYIWPTLEACEIHSMSMEFFAWPWMESFFGKDTDKYKYAHLEGALKFIPYGVLVDAFQHDVYEHPDRSPAERKARWRALEKKHMPYKTYDDDSFYERGGFWFRQSHIFEVPFYYIDYALAQVCAFQYWHRSRINYDEAWKSYVTLCGLGGSRSFLQLLEQCGLDNPFNPGALEKIMPALEAYLNRVDDTTF